MVEEIMSGKKEKIVRYDKGKKGKEEKGKKRGENITLGAG